MAEGLDAKLEAESLARRTGIGWAVRFIRPHGHAKDRREAVEQVMKKIDGNVKADQFNVAPTFLVVSAVRTALHQDAENLRKWLPYHGEVQDASGQLFAVAAHRVGERFYFSPEWGPIIQDLGPLERAGILSDRPFIVGMIFLATESNMTDKPDSVDQAYRLSGIWNAAWERDNAFAPEVVKAARTAFERLCHAWNDTEDSRCALLPTR